MRDHHIAEAQEVIFFCPDVENMNKTHASVSFSSSFSKGILPFELSIIYISFGCSGK